MTLWTICEKWILVLFENNVCYNALRNMEKAVFSHWTFLSNHAHVLVCLARNRDMRSRQVADLVGITERQVFKIISDLEESGVLVRIREGRRNHYEFHLDANLRHPLESQKTVRDLIRSLLSEEECSSLGI